MIRLGILGLSICLCSPFEFSHNRAIAEFPNELTLYILNMLPASVIASTATVSVGFNSLSHLVLRDLFSDQNSNGDYILDPAQIYSYYNNDEPSPAIKCLTLRALNSQRLNDLSCESFENNQRIDFYCDNLFSSGDVNLYHREKYSGDALMHLILMHRTTTGSLSSASFSPECIKACGVARLKGKVYPNLADLIYREYFRRAEKDMKRALLDLFDDQTSSQSLKILFDTENVDDPRLRVEEISAAEIGLMSQICNSQQSIQTAMKLSSDYIKGCSLEYFAAFLETIENTAFFLKMIEARDGGEYEKKMLYLIFYLRPDAHDIFMALNDVEKIQRSIESGTSDLSIEKTTFGLVSDLEDAVLLPIIESMEMIQTTQALVLVASHHKRSFPILSALCSKSLNPKHPIGNDMVLPTHVSKRFPHHKNAALEYSLEEMIQLPIESTFLYFTLPKKLEWMEHLLDTRTDAELELVFSTLMSFGTQICSDRVFRKFLRRRIAAGLFAHIDGLFATQNLNKEIEREIECALAEGLNPVKIFRFDGYTELNMNQLQQIVLERTLNPEKGFEAIVSGNFAERINLQPQDMAIGRNRCRAKSIIKSCLSKNISFAIPQLVNSTFEQLLSESLEELLDISSVLTFMQSYAKNNVLSILKPAILSCMSDDASPFHRALKHAVLSRKRPSILDELVGPHIDKIAIQPC